MTPRDRLATNFGKLRALLYLTAKRRRYDKIIACLPQIRGTALVLGSSPRAERPKGLSPDWFVVSVNGSQIVGESFGIERPDLTFMRNGLMRQSGHTDAVWQALAGRSTKCLIASISIDVDRGMAGFISTRGYTAYRVVEMSRHIRGAIILDVLGSYQVYLMNKRSISNGIFAALLAYKLGASEVVLSGMSMSGGGQFVTKEPNYKRVHLNGDREACRHIVERALPIVTEDRLFAQESGLRLRTP